jgi:hypothetical protein
MSIYAPLRDAFSDFNKMLIDSQTWKERHAANQQQQEYNFAVLESKLAQQEVSNRMNERSMRLREEGLELEADALDHRIMNDNRDYDLAVKQGALREKEVNQTIENQKSLIEKRQQEMALIDEQLADTPVNVNGIIDPDVFAIPEARDELNSITHGLGFEVAEDGIGYTEDGVTPYQMKNIRQNRDLIPRIAAINAKYGDDSIRAGDRIIAINEQVKNIDSTIKELGARPVDFAEKAMLKREKSKLMGEAESLAPALTVDSRMRDLRQRAGILRNMAQRVSGDEAINYRTAADALETQAAQMQADVQEDKKASAKKGASTARDDISVADMTNFKDEFKQEGMQAMWASNVGRDIKQNLAQIATVTRHLMEEDTPRANLLARQHALAFWRGTTQSYFDDVDEIPATVQDPELLSRTLAGVRQAYVQDLSTSVAEQSRIKNAGGSTKQIDSRVQMLQRRIENLDGARKKKQHAIILQNFAKYEHEMAYKQEMKDLYAVVPAPNNSVRKMLLGEGLADQ